MVDSHTSTPLDLLDTAQAGPAAIRGGALRVLGYVFGVGLSVISSALLFRHLGVVATGQYVTVLSLVTLMGGITDTGLATIGVRELSTLKAEALGDFFGDLSGLRFTFAAVGALAAVAVAGIAGYPPLVVAGTLVAGGGLMLQTTQNIYTLPLQAQLRLGWATVIDIVRHIGTAVTVVLLVLLGAPLLPFWAATIPSGVAATALGASRVRGALPLRLGFNRKAWSPLLRRTLPYSLASAVGVLYLRLAILIVSLVSSGRETGYFGTSFRVVEVLSVVPQLILGATFPIFSRAARDDRGRLDYALGRMFDVCLLLGLATSLALITGAGFIIEVIAGPRFGPSDAVLRVQGLAMVATFMGAVFGYGLLSLGRYRAVLWINVSGLAMSGALTSVLAADNGALGAAEATTIVEVLYNVMLAVAIFRAGVRPELSLSAVPRALLAALLGLLALVPAHLPDVVRPVLALTVYGAALLLFRAVPRELLEQLPRLHRSKGGL